MENNIFWNLSLIQDSCANDLYGEFENRQKVAIRLGLPSRIFLFQTFKIRFWTSLAVIINYLLIILIFPFNLNVEFSSVIKSIDDK